MSQQIAVRLSEEELAALDALVSETGAASRAEVVRAAIGTYEQVTREQRLDRETVEAYTREPQSTEGLAIATATAIASIEEEQWKKWW